MIQHCHAQKSSQKTCYDTGKGTRYSRDFAISRSCAEKVIQRLLLCIAASVPPYLPCLFA
jgi:hypothetical protein